RRGAPRGGAGLPPAPGALRKTREPRAGSADPGPTVRVEGLAPPQPVEEIVDEGHERVAIRRPAEVGDRMADDLDCRRLVGGPELGRHLVIVEQAGDRADTRLDQIGAPRAEGT